MEPVVPGSRAAGILRTLCPFSCEARQGADSETEEASLSLSPSLVPLQCLRDNPRAQVSVPSLPLPPEDPSDPRRRESPKGKYGREKWKKPKRRHGIQMPVLLFCFLKSFSLSPRKLCLDPAAVFQGPDPNQSFSVPWRWRWGTGGKHSLPLSLEAAFPPSSS